MDTIQIPGTLPATVTRPRPLIEAVMAQSLREQGPGSRTAAAWRWVLTGARTITGQPDARHRQPAGRWTKYRRSTPRRRRTRPSAAGRPGGIARDDPTGSRPAACCAG